MSPHIMSRMCKLSPRKMFSLSFPSPLDVQKSNLSRPSDPLCRIAFRTISVVVWETEIAHRVALLVVRVCSCVPKKAFFSSRRNSELHADATIHLQLLLVNPHADDNWRDSNAGERNGILVCRCRFLGWCLNFRYHRRKHRFVSFVVRNLPR
jgi:hypothetical protein